MKKKINRQLMFLSSMAIVITLLLMAVVFYRLFQAQVMEDLRIYAQALADGGTMAADEMPDVVSDAAADDMPDAGSDAGAVKNYAYIDRYSQGRENVRATVITPEGEVLYDSNADIGGMDNHAGRPEVAEALREGEGRSVRQSSTMQRSTFYYTILLPDGNVLRVARESHSIWSILYRSLPAILAAVCAILALCVFLSRYLTASLVAPIGRLVEDMDHIGEKEIYEELLPFAKTIRTQHDAIVRNANMRQEFSANVSHELKTPLASMKVLADSLLTQENVPAELYREFMTDIAEEIDRENKIITDLLSLVKMTRTSTDINVEEVDINAVLELLLKRLGPIASRADVKLIFESRRPVSAEVDEVKLTLALSNLVENGIKYNNKGGWVKVILDADHQYFTVEVSDSGVGIPPESIEHIYERFYRVDKSHSKEIGGTGLGLAITRSAILRHRGSITVNSEEGVGTVFSVRIPLTYIAQ